MHASIAKGDEVKLSTTVKIAILCLVGASLAGCAWLPAAGPTANTIVNQAGQKGQSRYLVINVNEQIVDTLLKQPPPSFQSLFAPDMPPPPPTISVGDALVVTIWEASGGYLFAEPLSSFNTPAVPAARGTVLPEQLVLPDGSISIPFAGRIAVVGHTPLDVQAMIEQRLQGKTVAPQALVTVTRSAFNSVTVTGGAVNGARVPLSPKGDHILDVIATVGGIKSPIFETYVRLTRNGVTGTIPLSVLIENPRENIYVWPGDTVTIVQTPHTFEAFGATGRSAQINFDQANLTVAQALGKSGGLLDDRADSSGVFLIRYEPRALVASMTSLTGDDFGQTSIPVIYRFDFTNVHSYFQAQRFPVADSDILLAANAQSSAIQKFFQLFGTITSPVISGAAIKNSLP